MYDLCSISCRPVVSSALLSLHAFTGCDGVSCFNGKEKIKSFELIKKRGVYAHFQTLRQQLESDRIFIPVT